MIKNRLSVTRNSRKSLLPKQVFSIILSLMVFNCYNLLIFYYILRDVSESSLFFLWGTSRSLFIWTSSTIFPPNFIFGCFFFFFNMSVLILTLSNPSVLVVLPENLNCESKADRPELRVKGDRLCHRVLVCHSRKLSRSLLHQRIYLRPVSVWVCIFL